MIDSQLRRSNRPVCGAESDFFRKGEGAPPGPPKMRAPVKIPPTSREISGYRRVSGRRFPNSPLPFVLDMPRAGLPKNPGANLQSAKVSSEDLK
jgi:hypothetical protein